MDANGDDLRRQIEEWQREIDGIVGEDFTPERSRRVEELERLIGAAWAKLDPNGIGRLDGEES